MLFVDLVDNLYPMTVLDQHRWAERPLSENGNKHEFDAYSSFSKKKIV